MWILLKINILLLLFVHCISSFRVLVAIPTTVKSLHGLLTPIALGLADKGHDVTFFTPFSIDRDHPNVTLVRVDRVPPVMDSYNFFEFKSASNITRGLADVIPKYVHAVWSDEKALDLWSRRKEFDLVIMISYYSETMFPLFMDCSPIVVQVCTPGVESVSLSQEGNWLTPSVVPSILLNYDEYMNFWERVINLPASISYYFLQKSSMVYYMKELTKYFPEIDENESYYDRVALTLINGNFALDSPVPLLPSQIEIGTINAKKPKPLEKNLKKFVDSAGEEGIIYFSLGSIAKSTDIPRHAKEVFVEAFKKVPQKVLWKYEGTDLDLPSNVLTQKWMPQQDILGHPKTKVFISHCGNLGTQEAKYHGVPVLALPIAFDQPRNAARMQRKGYALVLQWEDLTVEDFVDTLNILINDTQYQDRMDAVSRIVQDQKESPVDTAVWWLEYVVRHKGAPHLQYAGRRLSLFQYVMLDVILFWSAVLLVIVLAVVYGVRAVCCRGTKGEERQKQTMKKKQ